MAAWDALAGWVLSLAGYETPRSNGGVVHQVQPPLDPVDSHRLIGEIAMHQRDLSFQRADAARQVELPERQIVQFGIHARELFPQCPSRKYCATIWMRESDNQGENL